jgi:ubiquinone/menaquinone biosynthesis C-methylase UbiE
VSRAAQIRFLSRVARLYDPAVRAMGFRSLWESLAEGAAAEAGTLSLDVCTGTGGVALAVARRGPRVVGVDLSAGMLRRARSKARVSDLADRARWVQMDACRLGFRDASFPLVTCAMALHEMAEPEREAVLRELRRVASDRVVIADYRVPSRAWRALLFRVTRAFEFLESDDFGGFLAREVHARLEEAGFGVGRSWDAGPYRIWPCQVDATSGTPS